MTQSAYLCFIVALTISSILPCKAQYIYTERDFKSDTLSTAQVDLIIKNTKQHSIIGLGEADHLKGTFYRIKSQLVRELILQNHFDLLLLEADMNTCLQLNKYIKGDTTIHLNQLLPEMNATNNYILHNVYNTPEIDALLNWIKAYNTSYNNKITLAGIDFQHPQHLGNVIKNYLPQALQSELADVVNVYSKYYHDYMDYKNIFRIYTADSLKKEAATAAGKVQHISNYLGKNEDKYLQANLASLVCMSGFFTDPNGIVYRDTTMFNNLCLQIGTHKAMIWAAAQHLQESNTISGQYWMGAYIRRKWNQQYCNIGIYGPLDCMPAPVKDNTIALELLVNNATSNCLQNNNESIIISVKAKTIPYATVL
jgi:erythromycin esterase-like protein